MSPLHASRVITWALLLSVLCCVQLLPAAIAQSCVVSGTSDVHTYIANVSQAADDSALVRFGAPRVAKFVRIVPVNSALRYIQYDFFTCPTPACEQFVRVPAANVVSPPGVTYSQYAVATDATSSRQFTPARCGTPSSELLTETREEERAGAYSYLLPNSAAWAAFLPQPMCDVGAIGLANSMRGVQLEFPNATAIYAVRFSDRPLAKPFVAGGPGMPPVNDDQYYLPNRILLYYSADGVLFSTFRDPNNCTGCPDGLFGSTCNQLGIDCRATRCNGAGECTGQTSGCACNPGYTGANCTNFTAPAIATVCDDPDTYGVNCTQNDTQCATDRCGGLGLCTGTKRGCDCDNGYSKAFYTLPVIRGPSFKRQPLAQPRAAKYVRVRFRIMDFGQHADLGTPFYFELYANGTAWDPIGIQSGAIPPSSVVSSDWGAGHPSCWKIDWTSPYTLMRPPGCLYGSEVHSPWTALRWVQVELPSSSTVVTGIGIFFPTFRPATASEFRSTQTSNVDSVLMGISPGSVYVDYSNGTQWVSSSDKSWLTTEDNCDGGCGPTFFNHGYGSSGTCNVTSVECANARCSGSGTCYRNSSGSVLCACDLGYTGANCSTCEYLYGGKMNDPCRKCAIGMYGPSCNLTVNNCSTSRCSGNGACTGELEGCVCTSGSHFGPTCNMSAAAFGVWCGNTSNHETPVVASSGQRDGVCTCAFDRPALSNRHWGYFLHPSTNTLRIPQALVWNEATRVYEFDRNRFHTMIAKIPLALPAINATKIRIVLHTVSISGQKQYAGLRFELYSCGAQGGTQNCTANGFVPLGMQSGAIADSQIWGSTVPVKDHVSPPRCARPNQEFAPLPPINPNRLVPTDSECFHAGFAGVVYHGTTYPSAGAPQFIQVDFVNATSVYALGFQAAALRTTFSSTFDGISFVHPNVFSVWYQTVSQPGVWQNTAQSTGTCSTDLAAFKPLASSNRSSDVLQCRTLRCNGYGWCAHQEHTSGCVCDPGYEGVNCELCRVNSTFCGPCEEVGKYGANCNETAEQCALSRCSGHGTCVGDQSGCTCDANYFGARCNYTGAACATAFCDDDGTCVAAANAENLHCVCGNSSTGLHLIRGWDLSKASDEFSSLRPRLHMFDPPFTARYVAILQDFGGLMATGGISLRFELYAERGTSKTLVPLGMESGAIPTTSLYGFSTTERARIGCVRLNQQVTAACPWGGYFLENEGGSGLYIIVDLGAPTLVSAIAIQRAIVRQSQGGSTPWNTGPFEVFYTNTTAGTAAFWDPASLVGRSQVVGDVKLKWAIANSYSHCEHCALGTYGAACNETALQCSANRCNGLGLCTGEEAGCSCAEGYLASTGCEACVDDTGELCGDTPGARLICQHVHRYGVSAADAPACNLTAAQCAVSRCLSRGECIDTFHGCECVGKYGSGQFYVEAANGSATVLLRFPKAAAGVTHLRFYSGASSPAIPLRVEAYTCTDQSCVQRTAIGLANHTRTPDTHFYTLVGDVTSQRYPWCARLGRDYLLNPQLESEASDPTRRCLTGAYVQSDGSTPDRALVVRLPVVGGGGGGGTTLHAVAVQGDPRVTQTSPTQLFVEYTSDNGTTWHPVAPKDCSYCRPGLYGPNCDESFEFCTAQRCTSAANGHCTSRSHPDHPVCECKSGFYEISCAISAAECAVSRCSGAGNCTGQLTGCRCNGTTFGPSCLLTAAQCAALHCGNGTTAFGQCTDVHSQCQCNSAGHDATRGCVQCLPGFNTTASPWPACAQCRRGFFGASCEQTAAQCRESRCHGRSACTGRLVGCAGGSTDESGLDECGPHGTIITSADVCDCDPGYIDSTDDAAHALHRCVLPCVNGGTYSPALQKCVCPKNYDGNLCQKARPTLAGASSSAGAIVGSVIGALALLIGFAIFKSAAAGGGGGGGGGGRGAVYRELPRIDE